MPRRWRFKRCPGSASSTFARRRAARRRRWPGRWPTAGRSWRATATGRGWSASARTSPVSGCGASRHGSCRRGARGCLRSRRSTPCWWTCRAPTPACSRAGRRLGWGSRRRRWRHSSRCSGNCSRKRRRACGPAGGWSTARAASSRRRTRRLSPLFSQRRRAGDPEHEAVALFGNERPQIPAFHALLPGQRHPLGIQQDLAVYFAFELLLPFRRIPFVLAFLLPDPVLALRGILRRQRPAGTGERGQQQQGACATPGRRPAPQCVHRTSFFPRLALTGGWRSAHPFPGVRLARIRPPPSSARGGGNGTHSLTHL